MKIFLTMFMLGFAPWSIAYSVDQKASVGLGVGQEKHRKGFVSLSFEPQLTNLEVAGLFADPTNHTRWLQVEVRQYPETVGWTIERFELFNLEQEPFPNSDEIAYPWMATLRLEDSHLCKLGERSCYRLAYRSGIGMGRGFSAWPQFLRAMLFIEVGSGGEPNSKIYAGPGLALDWLTYPTSNIDISIGYEVIQRTMQSTFSVERLLHADISCELSEQWLASFLARYSRDYQDYMLQANYSLDKDR